MEEGKGLREGWNSKEVWKTVESWLSLCLLEEFDQFVHGHFDVAQYGTQQAGTERFAGVRGDSGGSAVRVLEKDMAAAGSIDNKAAFFEGADHLSSLGAGKTCHT